MGYGYGRRAAPRRSLGNKSDSASRATWMRQYREKAEELGASQNERGFWDGAQYAYVEGLGPWEAAQKHFGKS